MFEGFDNPDRYGFTRIPHDWIDLLPAIESLAELKILLYVARHTWGFQEVDTWKRITLEQFMHGRNSLDNGTGLSRKSVVAGLKQAIDHGYLLCKTDDKDKARIKKWYKLTIRQDSEV